MHKFLVSDSAKECLTRLLVKLQKYARPSAIMITHFTSPAYALIL